MKLYVKPEQFPSPEQFQRWIATYQQLKQELQTYAISLSLEERRGRRKMGPRRLAYAQNADRRGIQHEEVMPRTFYATNFTQVIQGHQGYSQLMAFHSELGEILDDTSMAFGIDAMTYTKIVHDGLRSANQLNPIFDDALRELDEYNKRAQAEADEEEADDAPVMAEE